MVGVRHEKYTSSINELPFSIGIDIERSRYIFSKEQNWHENIEICFIKRGDFSFFADGEHIDADTGDIVTFGEYSVHRFMRAKGFRDIYLCQFPVSILLVSGVTLKPLKTHITAKEIKAVPGLATKLDSMFNMLMQEQR